MCGIAGFFHPEHLQLSEKDLAAMTQALTHRGPDQAGFFQDKYCGLGARRLKIIDLTGGMQPIYAQDHGLICVCNGEIYNYQELRKNLQNFWNFQSKSDTEVLLAAYARWGSKCLEQIHGMFAFAIWDVRKHELFLTRDRIGKKPLFHTTLADGTLLFASEIKALLRVPAVQRVCNPLAFDRMLDYGFTLAPETFLQDIKQLMPGTFLLCGFDGKQTQTYWDLPVQEPLLDLSFAKASDQLLTLLQQAVQSRMIADVPVASYLSGGIDSSLVTALFAKQSPNPVHTLSITFTDADYDEAHFARMVAKHCGTLHQEIPCDIEDTDLENLIWHLEMPLVTLLNLPLFLLSRHLKSLNFPVVLSGDGADEIFGGYDYFKLLKLMPMLQKQPSPRRIQLLQRVYPKLATLEQCTKQYQMLTAFPLKHKALPYRFQAFAFKPQLLSDAFLESIAVFAEQRQTELPNIPEERSLFDQALYFESKMRLPNLTLPLADGMSMANSIELRSPFLDHRVMEFVFRLPPQYKMRALQEKTLLKHCAQSLLPYQIPQRRKQPLSPPGAWFVRKFRERIFDSLSEETVRKKGYFRPEMIQLMQKAFDSQNSMDYSGVLIVAFFVHLWDDLFLRGTHSC